MDNKAVLYLRVSTEQQENQRQFTDLQNWCNGKYEIEKVFEDKLSGFDTERRHIYW